NDVAEEAVGRVDRRRGRRRADEEAGRRAGERAAQGVGHDGFVGARRVVGAPGEPVGRPDHAHGQDEPGGHGAQKRRDRARPARMDPPAELRGEQWTRPDYGGRPVTVTPAAPTAGPHHDVQPLLDLAVVMAESDDVEAILELATAAVPTLAPGRCGGVRGPGAGPPDDGGAAVAYPLRTASYDHGFLLVEADRALLPEEDGRLRLLAQQTAVAL